TALKVLPRLSYGLLTRRFHRVDGGLLQRRFATRQVLPGLVAPGLELLAPHGRVPVAHGRGLDGAPLVLEARRATLALEVLRPRVAALALDARIPRPSGDEGLELGQRRGELAGLRGAGLRRRGLEGPLRGGAVDRPFAGGP